MKNKQKGFLNLGALIILGLTLVGGATTYTLSNQKQKQIINENPDQSDFLSMRPQIDSLVKQDLSEAEKESLLFMREEEKLARDVYSTLYEKWGLNIFNNISQSEQTHTESVRQLLVKYNIKDPVIDDGIGKFTNEKLAALYNELILKGEVSIEDALKVGALIEDLDIKDLQDNLLIVDNDDIKLVYENLMKGSRNHLRSFTTQLEKYSVEYNPQYITQEDFDTIISTDRETGNNSGNGRGWGKNR